MGRRTKPPKGQAEAKRPLARKSPKEGTKVGELEKRLAEALKREAESLEQQTATSEILRVISGSPTSLQPVLDAIAANAARVCGAHDATVLLREGDFTRRVAHHGPILNAAQDVRPLSARFASSQAIREGRSVHVHDIRTTDRQEVADARESSQRRWCPESCGKTEWPSGWRSA